jgi:hypothetical protein
MVKTRSKNNLVKTLKRLNPYCEELINLVKKNNLIKDDINGKEREIFKLYVKLFSNFLSKKTETGIYLNPNEKHNEIFLNEYGFSLKYNQYYSNTSYISKFKELLEINNKKQKLCKFIVNKSKKALVKRFFKDFNLITKIDLEMEQNLNSIKKVFVNNEHKEISFNKIKINDYYCNPLELFFNEERVGSYNLLSSLGIGDYVFIEQHFYLIRDVLKRYNRLLNKMLNQREKLFENIKKEFISELLLTELKKEN